jgi:hypothetical protein
LAGAGLTFAGQIGTIALCWMLCAATTGPGAMTHAQHAPEFSADIVSRDAAGLAVGAAARIYVANHRVRIETPEAAGGFFLIDADAGTAHFVLIKQRVLMDAKQSSRLTQVFVPMDTDDSCGQWQAAASNAQGRPAMADWRCERIDEEGADGRRVIEFRVAARDGAPSLRWVDLDLKFPLRSQAADGTTIALEHVRIEAQPSSLFTIPPGFRKFDPAALIERIKHSDAWVDP